MNRISKAIRQEYGDKVPAVKKNAPVKMATAQVSEPKSDALMDKVLDDVK